MTITAKNNLKYQIELKGNGISKIILCENQETLIDKIKDIKNEIGEKNFKEYINKRILIKGIIDIEIGENK